ncbi:hypothetical protein FIBSPDRAFT_467606 [Athelia psychrophila]|uniref:Uncharacterized protein n=1 Tax=Athelia psychrophila TaxID=1759441 RepID=A0A167U2G7_9AGAM|nr:hypothetical protein FIBSPDRAFT_467606 [Fibularhizoctonia sp. CBS 109695]
MRWFGDESTPRFRQQVAPVGVRAIARVAFAAAAAWLLLHHNLPFLSAHLRRRATFHYDTNLTTCGLVLVIWSTISGHIYICRGSRVHSASESVLSES